MSAPHPPEPWLREVAEKFGWTLLHSLWQGIVVALALAVALTLLRGRSAAARHAACLLALLAMVVAAAVTLLRVQDRAILPVHSQPVFSAVPASNLTTEVQRTEVEAGSPGDAANSQNLPPSVVSVVTVPSEAVAAIVPPTWRAQLARVLPWFAALWGGGVLLLSLRHVGGWRRVRALRLGGRPAGNDLQNILQELCARYGLRAGAVRLLETVEAGVPMLTGLLRPVVLLPAQAVTGLSASQLEAILAHELAHLVRRDTWSNLALIAAETVFFYHPAVWWIGRRIRVERELAADDLALRLCADRRVYAGALARLAEFQQASPTFALAGTGGGNGSLLHRVRRIVQPSAPVSSAPAAWSLLLPPVLAGVALGLGWMAHVKADDAGVIHVAPGQSIQAAIDGAPKGATIRLDAGEWKEALIITKPVTLEGAGWEKTRLSVDEPSYLEMRKASTDLEPQRKAVKTIEDRRAYLAEHTRRIGHPALWLHDTDGVRLQGLRVQGLSRMGPKDGTAQSTLVCLQRAKATVSDCAFVGPYGNGIDLEDGSEAKIHRSLVAAFNMEGIIVAGRGGDTPLPASRLHLAESEVRNAYHYGVVLGPGCDTTLIERCRISGTAWHGIRYDDASPTIIGNALFGHARFGIYASGKTKATVRGNLFWRNEMAGMTCWGANEDLIEGNTFVGNVRSGLEMSGGAKPTVAKNIVASNPVAVASYAGHGDGQDTTQGGEPKLNDNLFWDNPSVVQQANEKGVDPQPAPGGSLAADPQFADAAHGDFTLAAGSPARQAGVGVADPLNPTGPVPLLAEERSIIPDGDGREFSRWTTPGDAKPSQAQVARWDKAQKAGWALTADLAPRNRDDAKRKAAADRVRQALDSTDPEEQMIGLSAFQNRSSWGLDPEALRPRLRQLLKSPDGSVRSGSLAALGAFGANPEDLDRALAMVDDPADEVRAGLPWTLGGLSNHDFTGKTGEGLLHLLDKATPANRRWLWRVMLDSRISPELEGRLVAAARRPDLGEQEEYNLNGALSLHRSRREPTVTLFMENAAKEGNVGNALYALQKGVEKEQQPRVAALAIQTLTTGETDGRLRGIVLAVLDAYGDASQVAALKEYLAKHAMTDDFRRGLKDVIAKIEARSAKAENTTPVKPALDEERRQNEEARVAGLVATNQRAARVRGAADRQVYSQEQLREIETLYQVANTKGIRNDESRASLRQLLEKYDRANRTGCATLYYGQGSEGAERLDYLTRAVEKFSDCYYYNGCQVGGYGRYLLAFTLWNAGQKDKARALVAELRTTYKNATDHHGRPMTELADAAEKAFAGGQ